MLADLRYVPAASLGWRQGPLDGLNCYMRGVEAALLHSGYTTDDLVECFVTPVELVPRPGPWFPQPPLRSAELRWLGVDDGFPVIADLVGSGTPVLLYPNGFFWPDDIFAGISTAYHHAVLIIGVEGQRLRVLDTDATESPGFVRDYIIDEAAERALRRAAALIVNPPPPRLGDVALDAILMRSLATLTVDLPGIIEYGCACTSLDERMARSWDLVVLGHWQPQLFVLSEILTGRRTHPSLAAALARAAADCYTFGTMLLGMHRYADPSVYRSSLGALRQLTDSLLSVRTELERSVLPQEAVLDAVHTRRCLQDTLDEAYVCTFSDEVPLPSLSGPATQFPGGRT